LKLQLKDKVITSYY